MFIYVIIFGAIDLFLAYELYGKGKEVLKSLAKIKLENHPLPPFSIPPPILDPKILVDASYTNLQSWYAKQNTAVSFSIIQDGWIFYPIVDIMQGNGLCVVAWNVVNDQYPSVTYYMQDATAQGNVIFVGDHNCSFPPPN